MRFSPDQIVVDCWNIAGGRSSPLDGWGFSDALTSAVLPSQRVSRPASRSNLSVASTSRGRGMGTRRSNAGGSSASRGSLHVDVGPPQSAEANFRRTADVYMNPPGPPPGPPPRNNNEFFQQKKKFSFPKKITEKKGKQIFVVRKFR